MLHQTFVLALLIVLFRPVRGEGRTWVHHPPPHPTFTTNGADTTTTTTITSRRGNFAMKKEDWKHITDAKPVSVTRPKRVVSHVWEDGVPQPSKYPYASGAFGLEPELGIH